MPLVVVEHDGRGVPEDLGAAAGVEDEGDVAADELEGEEVLADAVVEHEEPVRLERPEAEADVDGVVDLHLRQAQVGAGGPEGHLQSAPENMG